MGLSAAALAALQWLAEKAGGTVVGETVKKFIPFLDKSKKEIKAIKDDLAKVNRDLGYTERDVDLLLDELTAMDGEIEYLNGCISILKDYCSANGVPVREDVLPKRPKRRTVAQAVRRRRGT